MSKYNYAITDDKKTVVTFPISPGMTVYKLWYKPCHNGENYPDSYGCCGCMDKCDIKKEITEFVIPDVEWILLHYKDFGKVWFFSKSEAKENL